MTREPATDFQKFYAQQHGTAKVDPVVEAVLREVAQRLANTNFYPQGLIPTVGETIWQVLGEIQNLPAQLVAQEGDNAESGEPTQVSDS